MFYFLLAPTLTYHWILIAAAVIPAIFLMVKVYRSDKLEPENPVFLFSLAISGVISTFAAMVLEWVDETLLDVFCEENSKVYNVILYFVIVGYAEEGAKYFLLKRRTWRSPEFNCQFDAVVYSVFISLGFALWENISYVLHYGFSTALIRAVTAIPGHACFGVFMGALYGLARGNAYLGKQSSSKLFRIFAVIIPAFIHGVYDYTASSGSASGDFVFLVFIAVMFVIAFLLVGRLSKNDRYFASDRSGFDFTSL